MRHVLYALQRSKLKPFTKFTTLNVFPTGYTGIHIELQLVARV